MNFSLRKHYRRRRMQRWLRREALLLEREAKQLACVSAISAASELVDIVEGKAGLIYELTA